MPTALLLQTSRWRDAADDAALVAAARELAPVEVIAAGANPARTTRITGVPTVPADTTHLLRALGSVDTVVVLGGRPLAGHARTEHLLGLAELAALSAPIRAAGKRYALIGVGAGPITTRREAFWARQVVGGSSLSVLDDSSSVGHLTAVGVPGPLRTGADLAWLQLQDPPVLVPGGAELWCTATAEQIEAVGGADAFADQADRVLASLRRRTGDDLSVTVQAWHSGSAAGDDLDAAIEVADALHARGRRIRVAPPPSSMARERDVLRAARFCLSGHPHAVMTAAAAGVAMLAWPYERSGAALAARLELPVLRPGASDDDFDLLVASALDAAGQALPIVREQVAIASEVADLLRVLITQGGDPGTRPPQPGRSVPAAGLRPMGVMR